VETLPWVTVALAAALVAPPPPPPDERVARLRGLADLLAARLVPAAVAARTAADLRAEDDFWAFAAVADFAVFADLLGALDSCAGDVATEELLSLGIDAASAVPAWLPREADPTSVKGVPTRPAAPKPTPTEAAAKTAHRATSAKRLFTGLSVPRRG
jgi:hypothetical protein